MSVLEACTQFTDRECKEDDCCLKQSSLSNDSFLNKKELYEYEKVKQIS